MTATREEAVRTVPRPLIRTFWMLHRMAYRLSGGRFGLSEPEAGARFGMLRLVTLGRRSGRARTAIVGYFEDGPNLVTLAMNGWGATEPAWWLNLRANPEATVVLANRTRSVRARAAVGEERDRLWARFDEFPGWGSDLDALAARRPTQTTVVVFEPTPDDRYGLTRHPDARYRLRLRHFWIVPGLAIALVANAQANLLGLGIVGIVPLLVFGIAPDLPRLLGLGQPHAHGQMPIRAVPAFNLMHHPLAPLIALVLAAAGVLPPFLYVGALAWLGHVVLGLAFGDRLRGRDGFLRPLWPIGTPAHRGVVRDGAGVTESAETAGHVSKRYVATAVDPWR